MIKALLFGLSFGQACIGMAQEINEPLIEPMPYQTNSHYGRITRDSIRQVIIIRKLDQERNIHGDTSSIQFYDEEGRERKHIRFEKNKRNEITYFNYRDFTIPLKRIIK